MKLFVNAREVAQICNLLYRGFSIRSAREIQKSLVNSDVPPNAIRRYSRFKICAMARVQFGGLR
jgi:hypothetical protein